MMTISKVIKDLHIFKCIAFYKRFWAPKLGAEDLF